MQRFSQGAVNDRIREEATRIGEDLLRIRRELHRYPETGTDLPITHEIISRELRKIPGLVLTEHAAEGSGLIAVLKGEKGEGRTVLLRADIDALPIREEADCAFRSTRDGFMHACGHDGHASWLIGAARILSGLRGEFGGRVKFVFQPGEEIGRGARALIEKDHVLENPPVDMAFAAHGWPSIESGKIGIARRYAFGCAGRFKVKITGKKGHASWPEQAVDPVAVANKIYQHIPGILSRRFSASEAKVFSVTYMQAGSPDIWNIIPESCEFGGTMRAVRREILERLASEVEKEIRAVCGVYGASYEAEFYTGGEGVRNAAQLLEGVRATAAGILGEEKVFFIDEDNLGGENFSEFSRRIPSLYFYVGIRPKGEEEAAGLHSPYYRFDDAVLPKAAAVFAALGFYGCMGGLDV